MRFWRGWAVPLNKPPLLKMETLSLASLGLTRWALLQFFKFILPLIKSLLLKPPPPRRGICKHFDFRAGGCLFSLLHLYHLSCYQL